MACFYMLICILKGGNKMDRLEAVEKLEKLAKGQNCDLLDNESLSKLLGFKTELRSFCIGSKTYQELCDLLERCTSRAWEPHKYVKNSRYLDLTEFFDLGEAREIVREYMRDVGDIDYLYDEEARDLLMEMAGYESMGKFIELLVGYPAWEPRQSLKEAFADPEFFVGRKSDYSYEVTVMKADIGTIRGALGWLFTHAFPEFYS